MSEWGTGGTHKPEEVYQKRDQMLFEIHSDLKHLLKNFEAHVADDNAQAKKLEEVGSTVKELQFAHNIHSKFVWTAIPVIVGLAVKSVWDIVTGGHRPQ